MFENNQLTLSLAYILVLVMCMVSLVFLTVVRWMERDFYVRSKLALHGLFGFMLIMDLIWALLEHNGHQTELVTFMANAVWYCCFVLICYRWNEDCLQNLSMVELKAKIPQSVRLLPVALSWLFIGTSWWTGWVMGVTDTGCYVRGPYLWVVYAVSCFYLMAAAQTNVCRAFASHDRVERKCAISCLMATGTLILSAYLQYQTGFAFMFIGGIITMAIIDFSAQHKAMAAERIRAREDAFAAASHDIRTPLNAVIGFAELLKTETTEEKRRKMEDLIIDSGRTLMRMMNSVLDRTGQEASAEAVAGENLAGGRKCRVLVVDDIVLNRTVISALLKRLGHDDITQASDGDEALALLRACPDRYDLVLTDLQMPKMDGDELVRKIREDRRLARLQVHVITADVSARANWADVGFDGILIKPVTMDKLRSIIRVKQ